MEVNVNNCSPNKLAEYIDAKYYDAKKKKYSRRSVGWGKWSTEFNKALRARIESMDQKDVLCSQLKYVFNYWTVRSKLLELHFSKRKIFGKTKRRKLADELVEIRKAINDPYTESVKSYTERIIEGLFS